MNSQSHISIFTVLSFVFSGICFVGMLPVFGVMGYGLFYSGDPSEDIIAGIISCLIMILPLFIGFVVFLCAGIGLLKRKGWGFYFHIAGSILAAFSCIGIIYTVFALIFAFKPEFKAEFPSLQPQPPG